MPWLPDFVNAVALARRQAPTPGEADAVTSYLMALQDGDPHALETAWPGDVVVYDPRAGRVTGHEELTAFVKRSQEWLADRRASVETVTTTRIDGRAVVELMVHLSRDGDVREWPVAVVAESPDDRSVVLRTYLVLTDADEDPHLRPPILEAAQPGLPEVVSRLLSALAAGDTEDAVAALAPAATFREAAGRGHVHRDVAQLRSYLSEQFIEGGSIVLQTCSATDDGLRCAVEFNCRRWGREPLPPQPGIGVFDRDSSGLLSGVRLYHDTQSPMLAPSRTLRATSQD